MLDLRSSRTERSCREPSRAKQQRDLPQGVEKISQYPQLDVSHGFLPFWLKRSVSTASFLASISPFLSRLITSASLDPPNMRSIRSRTPWPSAFCSLTRAE